MAVVFSNNATTTLTSNISSGATSITVADGSVFPALSGSDYTYLTFEAPLTNDKEIVKLIARSGNTLTVVRAQDGTSASAFSAGDKCELRITAALLNDLNTEADTESVSRDGDSMTGNLSFGDNNKAIFGAGSDLQIYHDGNNSRVEDTGTGGLRLIGSNFVSLQSSSGENKVVGNSNGSVQIFYNNAEKLATTSTGIDVTGSVVSDGLTVDGEANLGEEQANPVRINSSSAVGILEFNSNTGVVRADGPGQLLFETGGSTDRLKIANNGDISFYEDTGTTAKLQWLASDEDLKFADSSKAVFGAGSDLQIYHDGQHGYINNTGTGSLFIQDLDGSGDIYLRPKSGQTAIGIYNDNTVEIAHAGNVKLATTSTGIDVTGVITTDGMTTSADINFGDNDKAIFGASSDLQIYHNGTDSYIYDGGTGDLNIRGQSKVRLSNAVGANYFQGTNGAEARIYYNGSTKLATTSTGIDVTGVITTDGMTTSADINFGDSDKAVFGAGSDLQIYHSGTTSFITENGTGDLRIGANNLLLRSDDIFVQSEDGTTNAARFNATTGVTLYRAGSAKLATTSTGIDVTGVITTDGMTTSADINFGDNNKAVFGAGPDLRIYHDGSNSYINDTTGTGNLYIASNQLIINNAANSENMARFAENGAATLYYDGAAKIATTSAGIDVTGTATVDALTSSGTINATGQTIFAGVGNFSSGLSVTGTYSTTIGTNTISFSRDGTSYIDQSSTNGNGMIVFRLGSTYDQRLNIGTTAVVLNEESDDVDFRVESNGATHMLFVDAGNDRVGVNESAPDSPLHVKRSAVSNSWSPYAGTTLTLEENSGNGNILQFMSDNAATGEVWFGDDDSRNAGRIRYEHANNKLELWTDGAERFSINSSGAATFGGAVTASAGATVGSLSLGDNQYIFLGDGSDGRIHFDGTDTLNITATNGTADVVSVTANNIKLFQANGNAFLTANANSAVVVNENSNDLDFRVESNDRTHMLFVEAGTNRVGINNSDPSSTLHVTGTYGDTGFIRMSGGAQEHYWYLEDALNSVFNIGTGSANAAFDFRTNNISKLKVGAGEVVANEGSADQDFRVESNNNANMLFVDAGNDRIGIGTNAPSELLHLQVPPVGSSSGELAIKMTVPSNIVSAQNEIRSGVTSGSNPYMSFAVREAVSPYATVERMRIEQDGKIRLGNSSDHVMVDVTSSNAALQLIDNSQSNPPTLRGNGPNFTLENQGYNRIAMYSGSTVVNDDSRDQDFRVESDSTTHALFVQGNDGAVGINEPNPNAQLHILGNNATNGATIKLQEANNNTSDNLGTILFGNNVDDSMARVQGYTHTNNTTSALNFGSTNTGTNVRNLDLKHNEAVFNENGSDIDFRVESDGSQYAFFVDGGTNNIGIQTATNWALTGGGSASSSSGVSIDMAYDGTIYAGSAYWAGGLKTGTGFFSDASGDRYKRSSRQATQIRQSSQGGDIQFKSQTSGSAGAVIAWHEMADFGRDAVVFNNGGANQDFRVESDTNSNALVVDAGTSTVGINTTANNHGLTVAGGGTMTGNWNKSLMMAANYPVLTWSSVASSGGYSGIGYDASTSEHAWNFWHRGTSEDLSASARLPLAIKTSQVIINEYSHDTDFRVESDSNANAFVLDAGQSHIGVNKLPQSSVTFSINSSATNASTYGFEVCNSSGNSRFISRSDGYAAFYDENNVNIIDVGAASTGATTFNAAGIDRDFIVESDYRSHALFVEGSSGNIGLNASTITGWASTINAIDFGGAFGGSVASLAQGSSPYGATYLTSNAYLDTVSGVATNNWKARSGHYSSAIALNTDAVANIEFFKSGWTTGGNTITWFRPLRLIHAESVFNEDSYNVDFRVESDNNSNAVFVNAETDSVHFGTSGNFGGSRMNVEHPTDCFGLNLGPNASGSRFLLYFNYNGTNIGSVKGESTGVTYNTTSDRRLKKDIETITDGTDKLMAMNPVTHGWKADPEADAVHGFIAQEMMDIVPEAVSGDPEGDEMMSMDYGRITPVLVAALQDAHKKIAELETRLNELEGK